MDTGEGGIRVRINTEHTMTIKYLLRRIVQRTDVNWDKFFGLTFFKSNLRFAIHPTRFSVVKTKSFPDLIHRVD